MMVGCGVGTRLVKPSPRNDQLGMFDSSESNIPRAGSSGWAGREISSSSLVNVDDSNVNKKRTELESSRCEVLVAALILIYSSECSIGKPMLRGLSSGKGGLRHGLLKHPICVEASHRQQQQQHLPQVVRSVIGDIGILMLSF
jgi:hypothetical protein